jgi:ketosteroid isomerase-like protein
MEVVSDLSPKWVVDQLFKAFGTGDLNGIRNSLADEAEWIVSGDPKLMPWAGVYKGPDAVLKLMSNNSGSTENLKITIKWSVSEGDKVIMLINEQATVGQTGKFYEVDSVHIYTVKDGKIIRFENHFNPLPILEATFGDFTFLKRDAQLEFKAIKEEWTFFDADNKYHHSEEFHYEYDANGTRSSGQMINYGRSLTYNLSYQYNSEGFEVGQKWVNSADEHDAYDIVNRFDEKGEKILGGKGTGPITWEYSYEYDDLGRRKRMLNKYSNGNSWQFDYYYDENGKCILGKGNASSGLKCTIIYNY